MILSSTWLSLQLLSIAFFKISFLVSFQLQEFQRGSFIFIICIYDEVPILSMYVFQIMLSIMTFLK